MTHKKNLLKVAEKIRSKLKKISVNGLVNYGLGNSDGTVLGGTQTSSSMITVSQIKDNVNLCNNSCIQTNVRDKFDQYINKFCDYHIVIIGSNGNTIYDSFFATPIPNYNDNPAVLQAINNQNIGSTKLYINCRFVYYLALYVVDINPLYSVRNSTAGNYYVILVSTDKKDDPQYIAWQRLINMDYGFITGNVQFLLSQFAPNSLFCSPGGCQSGKEAIFNLLNSYISSGVDSDIQLTSRAFYYDPVVNGGVLERLWSAIDTSTGERYEQDDAIVYRLDPCGFLIYYHEYFNVSQKVSNYMSPPTPNLCCEQSSPEICNSSITIKL